MARWEWRTFGDELGEAGERLAALEPELVTESDEAYLLSAAGVDAVKLRGGLLDVKHLEQVDGDGLELWRPVLKAPLPVSAADAGAVLAALRVHAALDDDAYDLPALVAAAGGGIRAVEVHKTRRHVTVGGCMAELTDVRGGGRSTRTIAIEAEDPARVIAAVRELGLGCATEREHAAGGPGAHARLTRSRLEQARLARAARRVGEHGLRVVQRRPAELLARAGGVHHDRHPQRVQPRRLRRHQRQPAGHGRGHGDARARDRDGVPAERVRQVGDRDRPGAGEVVDARLALAAHGGRQRERDVLGVHELERRARVGQHRPDRRLAQQRRGTPRTSASASPPATMHGRKT